MYGQVRCAGFGEGFEVALWLLDHQMHIQRQLGGALVGLDQERPHRDVRDEVAIHHIHVDPVGAGGFTGRDILPQTQVIRRDNGRSNDVVRLGISIQ